MRAGTLITLGGRLVLAGGLVGCGGGTIAAQPRDRDGVVAESPMVPGKTGRPPAQQKLDSHLHAAAARARGTTDSSTAPPPPDAAGLLALDGQGRVHVDVQGAVSPALLDEIVAAGGRVESAFPSYGAIRAWLPLTSVEALAARPDVTFIKPAAAAGTNAPR